MTTAPPTWNDLTVETLRAALRDHVPPSELNAARKPALVEAAEEKLGAFPRAWAAGLLAETLSPETYRRLAAGFEIDDGTDVPSDRRQQRQEFLDELAAEIGPPAPADLAEARRALAEPAGVVVPTVATAKEVPDVTQKTVDDWRSGIDLMPAPAAQLPELNRWRMMETMATRLARSSLIPAQFRNHPDDVLVILLEAHDLGLTTSMVLSEITVIDGKPAKSAYLLRFLVRRDGHKIWTDVEYGPHGHPVAALARGVRKDDPTTTYEARFTIDQAVKARLCELLPDGTVRARSKSGKVLPWEAYTEDVLIARATSRLCRRAFEDSIGGAAYVPEELEYVEAEGDETPPPGPAVPVPVPLDDLTRQGIRERLDALTDDLRTEVRDVWNRQRFPHLNALTTAHLGPIEAIIEARERRMPDEATIIPDLPDASSENPPIERPVEAPVDDNDPGANPLLGACSDCGAAVDNGEEHHPECPQRPF